MFAEAFALLGTPVTWIELAAFALAIGCVVCGILEIHWAWPLTMASSLLYGWLFVDSRLYGEATLQAFFVLIAAWGWWTWLRPRRGAGRAGGGGPEISRLPGSGVALALLAWALVWLALGLGLDRFTDTDVPFLDAFPTAGSVLGQVLLGRKRLENWLVWVVVNVASVGLFAVKGLWLTALLYAVFAVLSVVGLRQWGRTLRSMGPGQVARPRSGAALR